MDGKTCQKDLIPWLKRAGPRKVARTLAAGGREGSSVNLFVFVFDADIVFCFYVVLIICILAFFMELAWNLVQR